MATSSHFLHCIPPQPLSLCVFIWMAVYELTWDKSEGIGHRLLIPVYWSYTDRPAFLVSPRRGLQLCYFSVSTLQFTKTFSSTLENMVLFLGFSEKALAREGKWTPPSTWRWDSPFLQSERAETFQVIGVPRSWAARSGSQEPNLGPLQEQRAVLTAQLSFRSFLCIF